MYKHLRNLIIGLGIMIFGAWLYSENIIGGCPSCSEISASIAGIGFGIFLVSVIEYDQIEALKERKDDKTGGLNQEH